jgi:hypothetical protein
MTPCAMSTLSSANPASFQVVCCLWSDADSNTIEWEKYCQYSVDVVTLAETSDANEKIIKKNHFALTRFCVSYGQCK